jgi:hypothetical protein
MLDRVILLGFAGLLLACQECHREGCDALHSSAAQDGVGIAGIVASSSDVVSNGCEECLFGSTTVKLWQVDAPVGDATAASELTTTVAPTMAIAANQHYRAAAASGKYLLCVLSNCINIALSGNETATVNIKLRNGPTSFFLRKAGSTQLTEDYGFAVAYAP